MFKLVSDPTQLPVRSVEFGRDAKLELIPVQPGGINRDRVFTSERDGSRLVMARPAGYDYRLSCDYLDHEQYKALHRLKEQRVPLYLFPNFDEHTRLWGPLTGDLKALRYDPQLRCMESFDATFSRGGTAYYLDDDGKLNIKTSNSPRYEESNIGKGILLGEGFPNKVSPNTPTISNLVWSNTSGAGGSIAWTTDEEWPLYTATGCAEVKVPAGVSGYKVGFTVPTGSSSSDSSERHGFLFYFRGSARLTITSTNGASTVTHVNTLATTFDQGWQELWYTFLKQDAATDVTVEVELQQQPWDQTCYFGGVYGYQQANPSLNTRPKWNTNASRVNDTLTWQGLSLNPSGFTVTVCGLIQGGLLAGLLHSSDGDGLRLLVTDGGLLQSILGGDDTNLALGTEWLTRDGEPFWAAVRYSPKHSFTGDASRGTTVAFQRKGGPLLMATEVDAPVGDVKLSSLRPMGDGTNDYPDQVLPQHVRWDARAWSDAELQLHANMMTDDAFRDIHLLTQGRQYLIQDVSMQHRSGAWGQMVGDIQLMEVYRDPDWSLIA